MKPQSQLEKSLGIKGAFDYGVLINSTRTLRQLIGYLGLALPILLILFSPECTSKPIESISHYYYTRSGTFFTVILSLVGIFLIIYTKDFILSTLAGVCALLVVFLPTSQLDDACSIVTMPNSPLRENFHYFSAAIFLLILAFMCLRYFTKPDEEQVIMQQTKVEYKWVYQLCGYIMLAALALIGLRFLGKFIPDTLQAFNEWFDNKNMTFYMETVALVAFGIAWLVKGRHTLKNSEFIHFKNNLQVNQINE